MNLLPTAAKPDRLLPGRKTVFNKEFLIGRAEPGTLLGPMARSPA
jgi:hypothetical protein